MFDIMHNSFGEGFAQTGRQLTQHFYLTMFNTMSRSIEETKHKTLSKVTQASEAAKTFENQEDTVGVHAEYEQPHIPPLSVPSKMDLAYWKNLVKESRSRSEKGKVFLRIKTKELGAGTTSKTFEVRDTTKNKNMVVKIDLKVFNGDSSKDQETAMQRFISQVYAFQMAKYFRQVTSDLNLRPIYFLPPVIYKLSTPFNGAHYLYAEPLIDAEQWTKYTNNFQLCKSPTMASFSHFTHQMSKGYFMITDLQGTGSMLSDPAIHSTDMK